MRRYLMFFDDYPRESVNELFLYRLRKMLGPTDIEVIEEKAIPHLEGSLRARNYVAIILDIMAAFPENPDLEAIAGLEILRRCRAGDYGQSNSETLIYMRTARGELHVKEKAFELGCTDYFRVGQQDAKLLSVLKQKLV